MSEFTDIRQEIDDLLAEMTCPDCGTLMASEHQHYKCPFCGYRDTCCDGAPA